MTAIRPETEVVEARWQVMRAMDRVVRAMLLASAADWRLSGRPVIKRIDYPCIYARTPALGGHWTLFGTSLAESLHMTATVTIAVEFDQDRPVDLWISGTQDVAAGGCTRAALAEALEQCDGPLHQITPVAFTSGKPAIPGRPTLVLDTTVPAFALN